MELLMMFVDKSFNFLQQENAEEVYGKLLLPNTISQSHQQKLRQSIKELLKCSKKAEKKLNLVFCITQSSKNKRCYIYKTNSKRVIEKINIGCKQRPKDRENQSNSSEVSEESLKKTHIEIQQRRKLLGPFWSRSTAAI